MTCKHCIGDDYCNERPRTQRNVEKQCDGFKNKAEFVEVVHAHWEIDCDGYYPYCSNCRKEPEGRVMSKFCPDCGAKMDGDNDG